MLRTVLSCVTPSLSSRRQFTALRLELWLRTQLRMENLCFQGQEVDAWIPDVFRTARALARAISRHTFALGTVDQGGGMRPDNHSSFHVNGDRCSGDTEGSRSGCFEDEGSTRRDERKCEKCLKPPRQALASRLSSLPAAGELLSWVSNVVITAVLYKQWLPWQAFADELRELVLLYIQQPPQAAGGSDKGVGRGHPAASAASVFAACSLVLAWEAGEVRYHTCGLEHIASGATVENTSTYPLHYIGDRNCFSRVDDCYTPRNCIDR